MTNTSSRSSSSTMICPEKLVTRELSNMSIEAYYHGGKSASVPFEWESEPGTPKFKSKDPSFPPLTPPPSYHYCNKASMSKKNKPKKNPSSSKPNNILRNLFVKRPTRKHPPLSTPSLSPPPSSSLSSSSSSSYLSSSFLSPAYFSAPSSPVICSRKSEENEDLQVDFHNTSRWLGGCSFVIRKVLPRDFL